MYTQDQISTNFLAAEQFMDAASSPLMKPATCTPADLSALGLCGDWNRITTHAEMALQKDTPTVLRYDANKQSTVSYLFGLFSMMMIFGTFYILSAIFFFCLYFAIFYSSIVAIAIILIILSTSLYPSKVFWEEFIDSPIWRAVREYFSFQVVVEGAKRSENGEIEVDWYNKSSEEANKKQYLFVEFPHGVVPFGFILRITVSKLIFPGLRVEEVIASTVLMIPIIGHLCRWFGAHPATKKDIDSIVDRGSSVSILAGGVAEIFLSSKNEEKIFLKERKGFIRIALQRGLSLVPVYHFGNTQLYDYYGLSALSRRSRLSLLLFYGRFFSPIPYQHPLMMVIGKPIEVKQVAEPTNEQINELHEKFCAELKELFDRNKEQFGWGHKQLEIL